MGAFGDEGVDGIKEANPWFRQRGDSIYLDKPSGRVEVARVTTPGYGEADRVGEYDSIIGPTEYPGVGVGPPPYHPLCRSWITPVLL